MISKLYYELGQIQLVIKYVLHLRDIEFNFSFMKSKIYKIF